MRRSLNTGLAPPKTYCSRSFVMRLARIDQAIEVCEEHIHNSGSSGTEIEAFLTRYLMVLMCASFEEEIEYLVSARAEQSNDAAVASFVRSAVGHVFRSMKTSEISGLLGRFGPDHKRRFQEEMRNNQRSETFFNNIVINRHDTAHSLGSNVTLRELIDFYSEGHIVLDAVRRSLNS